MTRRTKALSLALFVVALLMMLFGVLVMSSCSVDARFESQPSEEGDTRITISADNKSLVFVLNEIARQSNLTLDLGASKPSRITIHAQDAKLDPLMTDLCTAYNCTWRVENGTLKVRMREGTLTPRLDRPTSYTPEG